MPSPLACPYCKRYLREVDYEGTRIDVCDCGGIWFDDGELIEWARTQKLNPPVPSGAYGAPYAAEPCRCPRCAEPTLQSRVLDGVHFASCTRCQGIWLSPEGVARMKPSASTNGSWWPDACDAFLQILFFWTWL